MFKPLPQGTIGYVTQAASRIATTLVVDTQLYTTLSSLLAGGHHTYLHVRSLGKLEIVKVVEVLGGSAISVKRGQDGTDRDIIQPSARIFYALCLAAIYDQVRGPVTSITLTATGVTEINESNIHVPQVVIFGEDGIEVTDSTTIWDGNYDPCGPYKCPGYELGPFYYTSHPYPIEEIDNMRGAIARFVKGLHSISAGEEGVDGNIASFTGGTIRAILQTYDEWPNFNQDDESIEGNIASFTGGTIRQILITYDEWPAFNPIDESIEGNIASFSGGTIRQILLTYEHWMDTNNGIKDECIKGNIASFVSGTLT
jgi:hypothetical protein